MIIKIIAVGKFEHLENGDEKIELEVDLIEVHNADVTLGSIITEKFEEINNKGCSCSFNERQNHCDCDGYGYGYKYILYPIENERRSFYGIR